jgi:hypothetical protein
MCLSGRHQKFGGTYSPYKPALKMEAAFTAVGILNQNMVVLSL